ATGPKPAPLPFMKLDKERILTSTEALNLKEIPQHLVIIGGGVIGLALGCLFDTLGATVPVVEHSDSIIPTMDRTMGKELQKSLKKLGFEFYLKHKVTAVENTGSEATVKAENSKSEEIALTGDYVLVAIGRKPYTEGLNAEAAGVVI